MSLFYSASQKELLELRNKVFLNSALPSLEKHRFRKSPFLSWFGKSDIGYTYEVCRLSDKNELEIIEVNIVRGSSWIHSSLNIFELHPKPNSLEQLKGLSSLNFGLALCNISSLSLGSERMRRPPNLDKGLRMRDHKIKLYFTKAGLLKRGYELARVIEMDMNNIDSFVKIWHQLHRPLVTTWDGIPIRNIDK